MKFDCIIQNPPYVRNLHIKILAEAIKHLKDEKSVCVNLSPVRWLQDPLAKYKKNCDLKRFEESVAKHIESLEVLDQFDCQALFTGAGCGCDLGTYVCSSRKNDEFISLIPSFVNKVLNAEKTHPTFDFDEKDGFRVRLPIMFTSSGGHIKEPQMESIGKMCWFENGFKDGKPWYDYYQRNQFSKTTDTIPCSIKFDTKEEAENFCKQYSTIFCKVYTHLVKRDVNISPMTILWLGDAINPRTGLKGYQGEWTNEDLVLYFGITPEEYNIINKTIAKYENKR